MNPKYKEEVTELINTYNDLGLEKHVSERSHEIFTSITKQAKSKKGISERQLEVIKSIVKHAKE